MKNSFMYSMLLVTMAGVMAFQPDMGIASVPETLLPSMSGEEQPLAKGPISEVYTKGDSVPEVEWDRLEYNFGKIEQGEKPEAIFVVTNHAREALVIENVVGSCGCVVSSWTKTPVAQEKQAEVKVSFDSKGKHGKQEKSVTVYTSKGLFTLYLYAWVDEN